MRVKDGGTLISIRHISALPSERSTHSRTPADILICVDALPIRSIHGDRQWVSALYLFFGPVFTLCAYFHFVSSRLLKQVLLLQNVFAICIHASLETSCVSPLWVSLCLSFSLSIPLPPVYCTHCVSVCVCVCVCVFSCSCCSCAAPVLVSSVRRWRSPGLTWTHPDTWQSDPACP